MVRVRTEVWGSGVRGTGCSPDLQDEATKAVLLQF